MKIKDTKYANQTETVIESNRDRDSKRKKIYV